jgi:hypothetical protein
MEKLAQAIAGEEKNKLKYDRYFQNELRNYTGLQINNKGFKI